MLACGATGTAFTHIVCRSCGSTYEPSLTEFPCPDCGGILDPRYDYATLEFAPDD